MGGFDLSWTLHSLCFVIIEHLVVFCVVVFACTTPPKYISGKISGKISGHSVYTYGRSALSAITRLEFG